MSSSRLSLSRRTLLRGTLGAATVRVGLPVLGAFMNSSGTAYADGTSFPLRFGVFYWGGGVHHPSWVPTQVGTTWTAPHSLQPLATAALKPYVTMVSGFNHRDSSPGHIPARGIVLSSSHDLTTGIAGVGTYRGQFHPEPSIDQVVAEAWTGQARFDWVGISICRKGPYAGNSSWRRGGTTNGFVSTPSALYQRLFGAPLPTGAQAYQRSVLDAVKADGASLKNKLGAEDQQRLDQHLDGVRALERRLEAAQTSCSRPNAPGSTAYGDGGDRELKQDKTAVMAELLSFALACDLVRTFTFEYSATQSEAIYWEVGASPSETHHDLTHAQDPRLKDISRLQMTGLATVAEALRSRREGLGTVLDNTLIFGTSEHASSGNHDYTDHPMIFVGKAGGRLRAGVHYRHPTPGSNLDAPKVLLTAARAVGVTVGRLGQTAGEPRETTNVVTDLLV